MSGTPFAARRGRRCACGAVCPEGGRIRPGQRVLRVRPKAYVHEADLPYVLELLAEAADTIAAALPIIRQSIATVIQVVGQITADMLAAARPPRTPWEAVTRGLCPSCLGTGRVHRAIPRAGDVDGEGPCSTCLGSGGYPPVVPDWQ